MIEIPTCSCCGPDPLALLAADAIEEYESRLFFSHRYLPGRSHRLQTPGVGSKYPRKSLSWRYNKTATASGTYKDIQDYRQWAWEEVRAGRKPKPPVTTHLFQFSVEQARRRREWYYRCSCCVAIARGRGSAKNEDKVAVRWRCKEGRDLAADSDLSVPGIIQNQYQYTAGWYADNDNGNENENENENENDEVGCPPEFSLENIPCRGPVYRLRYKYRTTTTPTAKRRQKPSPLTPTPPPPPPPPPTAEKITSMHISISDDTEDEESETGEWDFLTGDTDSGADSERDDDSVWTGMGHDLRIACGSDLFALDTCSDSDSDGGWDLLC